MSAYLTFAAAVTLAILCAIVTGASLYWLVPSYAIAAGGVVYVRRQNGGA